MQSIQEHRVEHEGYCCSARIGVRGRLSAGTQDYAASASRMPRAGRAAPAAQSRVISGDLGVISGILGRAPVARLLQPSVRRRCADGRCQTPLRGGAEVKRRRHVRRLLAVPPNAAILLTARGVNGASSQRERRPSPGRACLAGPAVAAAAAKHPHESAVPRPPSAPPPAPPACPAPPPHRVPSSSSRCSDVAPPSSASAAPPTPSFRKRPRHVHDAPSQYGASPGAPPPSARPAAPPARAASP